MEWLAIVGVDHVARGATARSIITWVIISPEEGKMRIVEPRLVKIDQARADAQPRSASAVAEANIRFACLVRQRRIADVRKLRPLRDSAALEGAEVFPRLRDLPPRQRKK